MFKNSKSKPLIKLSSFITFIFFYAVFVTGSTYAFMNYSVSNSSATGTGGCFAVTYTGQDLNAGNIMSTVNYLNGAHTTVTLSKNSSCKIYTEANIYLHTNTTSTAPVDTVPALKYKIFNHSNDNLVREGLVNSKNDYLMATVPITDSAITYDVYLWIDSDLSLGSYNNTTFSGYIFAESAQTSTIDQYFVTFSAGNNQNYDPIVVTYGGTYGSLPTPTLAGHTFLGWSYIPDDEYQQVEYITSTGTQYINTNYALWNDSNWKIDYMFSMSQLYNYNNMLGSLVTTNTANEIWVDSTGKYNVRFPDTGKVVVATMAINTPYRVIHDNMGSNLISYVNNTSVQSTRANTALNLNLGFGHRQGSQYLKGNMYYLNFWSNGSLVRRFIPCYKKTDSTHPGLYDVVSGSFFANAGSGDFTAGSSSYITSSSTVTQANNHTLYAVWS